MNNYKQPETLVTTAWVEEHASDPDVRIVEVDVDPSAYGEGHIANGIS